MQNAFFVKRRIRVRRRVRRFKTSALINRDIDENRAVRNVFQHIARNELRSRRARNQNAADNQIRVLNRFVNRVAR